jgi:hypothetical protein
VLPDRATTNFFQVDGELKTPEATHLIDTHPGDMVLVSYHGSHWLCTPEELARLLRSASTSDALGRLLAERYEPAAMEPVESIDPGVVGRVVITDNDEVVGAIVEGPLVWLGTTVGEEPPTYARAPEVGEGASPIGPSRGAGAEEEAGAEPAAGEPWYLETRFPRQVAVESTTSLVVDVTRNPDDGPEVSTLLTSVPTGTEVGVVVQAKTGFEIVGPSEGKLVVSDDSLPLRFQLNATAPGTGVVRVLFFVEATALGAVTLEPVIVEAGADADVPAVASSEVVSALSVGAGRPDLELLVLEESSDGRPRYSIRLTAADEALGIHLREFGPIELHTDARHFFAEMFSDIEALSLSTSDDRTQAQRLLETKGTYLFSTLFPEPLQSVLWEIRDRITRIRIDSEEPHIPWELIRLSGPGADGSIVEGKFLCEYEVTRWIPGLGLHSDLTMKDFGVVIPPDSGLASAQEEKTFLTGLATPDRVITDVAAAVPAVLDALASGIHDVWHFSGHGAVKDDQDPNRAAIQLAEGQVLTPEQLSGRQENLGKAQPLVFINACQVGRAAMSLTGLGGWANRFLHAGAAGFVGAMWNVHDNPARDFAQAFYTGLLDGNTIGAATLRARQQIQQYQDATWLAYTVYGHPSAALASGGD